MYERSPSLDSSLVVKTSSGIFKQVGQSDVLLTIFEMSTHRPGGFYRIDPCAPASGSVEVVSDLLPSSCLVVWRWRRPWPASGRLKGEFQLMGH